MDKLAEKILLYRKEKKLNQKKFAKQIGISDKTLSKIEAGESVHKNTLVYVERQLEHLLSPRKEHKRGQRDGAFINFTEEEALFLIQLRMISNGSPELSLTKESITRLTKISRSLENDKNLQQAFFDFVEKLHGKRSPKQK